MVGNRLDVQSAASLVFEDPLLHLEVPLTNCLSTPPRRGVENGSALSNMRNSGVIKVGTGLRPPLQSVENGSARATHSAAFNTHAAAASAAAHLPAKAAYKVQANGVQQRPYEVDFDPVQRLAALLEANRKVPRSPLESPQGKAATNHKKAGAKFIDSKEIAAKAPTKAQASAQSIDMTARPATTAAPFEANAAALGTSLHKLPRDLKFPSSSSTVVSTTAAMAPAASAASPLNPATAVALDRIVDHLRSGCEWELSRRQQQHEQQQQSSPATSTSEPQSMPSSPQPRAKSCPRPLPVLVPPPPIYASLAATIHRLPVPPQQQQPPQQSRQQQQSRQTSEKAGGRNGQNSGGCSSGERGRSRATTKAQIPAASSTQPAPRARLPPWMPSSWAPADTSHSIPGAAAAPSGAAAAASSAAAAAAEFASTYPPPRHHRNAATTTNTTSIHATTTDEGKPVTRSTVRSASCGRPISGLQQPRRKADAGAPGTPSALFAEAECANERAALEGMASSYGSSSSSGCSSGRGTSRGARGAEWVRLREEQLAQQQQRQQQFEEACSSSPPSLRSRSLDRDALQPKTPASPDSLGPSSYAVWLHSTSPKRRAPRPLPEACWPPKPQPNDSSFGRGETPGRFGSTSVDSSRGNGSGDGSGSHNQEYSSPGKDSAEAPKVPVSPASLAAAQIAAAAARLKLFAASTRATPGGRIGREGGNGTGAEETSAPHTPERQQQGGNSSSTYHRRNSPPLTPEAAAAMKAAGAAARTRKFPPSPPPGLCGLIRAKHILYPPSLF